MIYNITNVTFGEYGIRNGDMIAMINVLQWLRRKHNNPNIKFYITPEIIISDTGYHQKFFDFLCENYDYFSLTPGEYYLPYEHIMLWDFRDNIGDVVQIPNLQQQQKKLVVFPIFDAQYNTLRNWSPALFMNILEFCCQQYHDHERIVCIKELPEDIACPGFTVSTDFISNVTHLMQSDIYVGGDTGMSHLASALFPGPRELVYFYTCRGMIHTLPFYLIQGKGILNTYSSQYNLDIF